MAVGGHGGGLEHVVRHGVLLLVGVVLEGETGERERERERERPRRRGRIEPERECEIFHKQLVSNNFLAVCKTKDCW